MDKTLAFTLCSNNYLAFAKTLGDSYMRQHPGSRFVIGIVDKPDPGIDYSFFEPLELLFVDRVSSVDIPRMAGMYNIIEFNTAVKPFYIEYLFEANSELDTVIYFDPDIKCYGSLAGFRETMKDYSIGLTPHITTPVDADSPYELENRFLNFGLYNLGFAWMNRRPVTFQFLDWWKARLDDNCWADLKNGIFVDQLWVNFAPIFYPGDVHISYDLGMNMAHWNFHERHLSQDGGTWSVNGETPLKFFHFSGISLEMPDLISKRKTMNFKDRPDVKGLFDDYRSSVLNNRHEQLRLSRYQYSSETPEVKKTVRSRMSIAYYHLRSGLNALFK